jgi:uncharacterized cupin superfamily protein
MLDVTIPRSFSLPEEAFNACLSQTPAYGSRESAPAVAHADTVSALWGMTLRPLLSNPLTTGRFSQAAQACPVRSCVGYGEMARDSSSKWFRNADAIENIACLQGEIEIEFLCENERIHIGRFDFVSVPVGVKHRIHNVSDNVSRLAIALSSTPDSRYQAVFDESERDNVPPEAQAALSVSFDREPGEPIDFSVMAKRVTRFQNLVPYKKDLKATAGIPPEATEMLSAGSVYPLIVPEGHVGRSRTAPMYGLPGLYIAIAESLPGADDAPPPHAHSDTQENFIVLDGSWDMLCGLNREQRLPLQQFDLFATPSKVMRTFQNTSESKARLLVIIQGPEKMNDTVSFSTAIGAEIRRRFGDETIDAYRRINMTFDAE